MRTRSVIKGFQNAWAGLVIAALVPILVCRIIGFGIGVLWSRRRTRVVFRRSLLRAGLTVNEAESLTSRYHARITFRELLRMRHRFES